MIFNVHGNHSWRLNAFPFCLFSSGSQATSPTFCLFLSLKKMCWFCSSLVETLLRPGSHVAAHRLLCVSTPLPAPSGRSPSGAARKDTVRAALGGHVFVQIFEGWVRLKKPPLGLCNLRAPLFLSLSLFQRFQFSDVLFRQSASGSPHQEVGNFRKEIWIAAYHREWCIFGFQKEWGLWQGVTEITPCEQEGRIRLATVSHW